MHNSQCDDCGTRIPEGDDRQAALEQKRCAVYDLPHPPACRPPLDREWAAGVSTLSTVVESDSSPPHSEIDPHFTSNSYNDTQRN